MTTFPLATLAAQVTSTGISAPSYADILASLQASVQAIYGSDINLAPDTQDGQFLAIMAAAINDSNAVAIAVYNQFSPVTAQGVGLSSVVKINGLRRLAASNSTVPVTIAGTAGTVITNGIVADNTGTQWNLPATVTIPVGGSIIVTATCAIQGNVAASIGTVTNIITPTLGWQSVTNATAATPGNPVEPDPTLRKRQAASTALPAQSILTGIVGAIANLSGVGRYAAYENDTGSTDSNGIPARSIALVVEGGDAQTIANTIALKKTPGTGTYGTTTETVIDSAGVPSTINFFALTTVSIYVAITIKALTGYVSTTATAIEDSVAAAISALGIGESVYISKVYSPANLKGDDATTATGQTQTQLDALSATYNITALKIGTSPSPTGASDLTIAFNQAAICVAANVTVTVT